MNCELRASLPGFRSDVVSLASRRSMDNPDVGTIILHRMGNVEGLTISATSLNAPKDAKKAFDKGHEALGKNKLDDARKNLEKAVEIYPKYATAWYDLGVVADRQKNTEGARKAFGESLAADSKYMNPYDGLAQIAAREQKWQDVADITERMVRLNPVDFPHAYFLNAVANLNLNRLDPAEKSAKELAQMDTHHQFPRVEHVLGVILLNKQDYNEAAVHLRKYVEISEPGAEVDAAKKQLENLEKALAAKDQHQ
jgi:tetratricopeptide (TPR) repeat protein